MPTQTLIKRFLIWRYKHISQKNFVFLLSIIIGLLAGLISVLIKNITFGIEWFLDTITFSNNTFYFIFPIIGLWLVYLFVKHISKQRIEHAIPSILFSLSKKDGLLKIKTSNF